MKYAWLAIVLGFAGTALGQNPHEPPMIRAAMQTAPRYWTAPSGQALPVRFLTMDRSKVQLLVGDAPSPRIVTVQIPRLNDEHREWITQELSRRTQANKRAASRYGAR